MSGQAADTRRAAQRSRGDAGGRETGDTEPRSQTRGWGKGGVVFKATCLQGVVGNSLNEVLAQTLTLTPDTVSFFCFLCLFHAVAERIGSTSLSLKLYTP